MLVGKVVIVLVLVASTYSSPVSLEEKETDFEDDPFEYVQETVAEFLDTFLEQDNYQVSEYVEVNRNSLKVNENEERSFNYEDKIEKYIKTHDVTFNVPLVGKVVVNNQNLDDGEVGINIKFGGNQMEEGRKSKLKRILSPIIVFILLKAVTLVPLALGILSIKAFQSLQMSLIAFVISAGLAIFQLCKKIAENNAQAHITAHGPWEQQAAAKKGRSFGPTGTGQDLAYSAYRK